MFTEKMTRQDKRVYMKYLRLVEILTTNEYSDMYNKIGAIRATMGQIEDLMEDE